MTAISLILTFMVFVVVVISYGNLEALVDTEFHHLNRIDLLTKIVDMAGDYGLLGE